MPKTFKIRVDKEHYDVESPSITGREILALADKNPESHRLVQRKHGGQVVPVGPDEVVDLIDPGVERFMTLPLDQTEG